MFKNLLTSVFFMLVVLANPSFAGQDCYGGGADVNDSQKKEMKDKEA
jgi:hypothetical protein